MTEQDVNKIAIIGMSGRFPQAKSVKDLWKALYEGKETLHHFTKEELLPHEFDPSALEKSNYVRARGILDGIELFDAGFFGYLPREASLADPQQRIWLEIAWEALEQAGYANLKYQGAIGVFAGCLNSNYLLHNLLATRQDLENYVRTRNDEDFNTMINNSSAFLATRTAYKLNLKGPAVNVQTGCSTSLVAVVMAVQSLLQYESDICIAGGITISVPQYTGYFYQEGAILSKDGHCCPFDIDSSGTVFGSGGGAVVLKRLDEALEDRDPILAVIRGTAMNNDGADKVGFAAPSVNGQSEAILVAQKLADIDPLDISYIEAHGTATPLGDPIELAALTQAFGDCGGKKQFCGIGSVKSNIGHLDAAAGVAGLIKTVLSLQHEKLPPVLHFKKPNPNLNIENTPFYVVDKLTDWPRGKKPRIAGVSSFGVGGTNAHVIVEEAPLPASSEPSRKYQLLLLSAKTENSLNMATQALSEICENGQLESVADAAYTLHKTRRAFSRRRFAVCENTSVSVEQAWKATNQRFQGIGEFLDSRATVAFQFPGQGSLYLGIGDQLSQAEPVFGQALKQCCSKALFLTGNDISVLFSKTILPERFSELMTHNGIAQLAIFSFDYALAQLWMSWGITPKILIGHSLGEWVAACVSGVLSLEHAIEAVWHRGKLMHSAAGSGSAITVFAEPKVIAPYLHGSLCIAAENAPEITLVSGLKDEVDELVKQLKTANIPTKSLNINIAVHSPALDQVIEPFEAVLKKLNFSPPRIPIISPAAGGLLSNEQATDPSFWAGQLRSPVRFSAALKTLWDMDNCVLLEVGAGVALSSLAKSQDGTSAERHIVASLGNETAEHEQKRILRAVGSLWTHGVEVDADAFWKKESRKTIPLPTYCFDRKRHWVDPPRYLQAEVSDALESNSTLQNESSVSSNQIAPIQLNKATPDVLHQLVLELSGKQSAEISYEMSFLEMGFESLLLTQLASQIYKKFGVRVSFRQVMQDLKNINQLAQHIDSVKALSSAVPDSSSIKSLDNADVYNYTAESEGKIITAPATEAQREIWLSCQVSDEASCAYNLSISLSVEKDFDLAVFKKAAAVLLMRHNALRTSFSANGKDITVNKNSEPALTTVKAVTNENRENLLLEIIDKDSKQPFDLENGPLVRFLVVQYEDGKATCLITLHHIICDGWSIDVLVKELCILYTEIKQERKTYSLPISKSFFEYAVEERTREKTDDANRALEYWKRTFSKSVPSLDLPTDFPRPAYRTYDSAEIKQTIASDIYRSLKAKSIKENRSFFSLLLSALSLVLHKLSKQDDLVIGIPIAGQPMVSEPDLVGHCVSFLPVRTKINTSSNLDSHVLDTNNVLLNAYENYQCTYGQILQHIKVDRNASQAPLVSVVLTNSTAFQKGALTFDNVSVDYTTNPRAFETFDLYIHAREDNGNLTFICQYNKNIFKQETVFKYLKTYEQALSAIVEKTSCSVAEIDLLTEEDLLALSIINDTAASYPKDKLIHQMFEERAKQTPDKTAVVFGDKRLSYAELDSRANSIAQIIHKRDVSGKPVGLMVDRTPNMLAALYGILKTGAAYVPIDPDLPLSRIAYMLEDAQVDTVITEHVFENRIKELGVDGIFVEDISYANVAEYSAPQISPDSTVYIIYTSGSTGKPKGVEVSHRALVNLVSSISKKPGVTHDDVVFAVTTLSFDVAAAELHVPLTQGGTVVLASKTETTDGNLLLKQIQMNHVTLMQATPATWRLLIAAGWDSDTKLRVISTGEPLPKDLAAELLLRSDEVWNLYGPTETTIWSTGVRLEKGQENITIGKPIDNTQVYILDENFTQVLPGVVGELYIGGDGVAKGYINRPELTAERFIDNPFNPGSKMYRTGDLVRLNNIGELVCLGRTDFQVKLRGFRIELGEIETAIGNVVGIKQGIVVVKRFSDEDERLVAYCISEGDVSVEEAEIKTILRKKLPDYMVPQHYVRLDEFPLTANNKIDRKALLSYEVFVTADKETIEPRTETEESLVQIWREVLHAPMIGIRDDFFQMGGHSLLAAQMFAKVQTAHKVKLPFRTIFETPTIEGLAKQIDVSDETAIIPIYTETDTPPLSLMQQRLWFLNEIDAVGVAYNLASAVRLRGNLEIETLNEALEDIIRRHSTFRTSIGVQENTPVQVIAETLTYHLEVKDLSAQSESSREQEMLKLLEETAATPFDFARAPLFVSFLIRMSKEEHVFFFMPHHMIWDGWSNELFFRELEEHYNARCEGRPPKVSSLPISYGDFAAWHRKWVEGEELQSQAAYWREQLKGSTEALELPTDKPRPSTFRYDRGHYINFAISKEKIVSIELLAKRHNTTLFMVLLSAYKLLLHKLTGQRDILVGTPVRGRSHAEVENLIGFFSNLIVLRTQIDKECSFEKFLQSVKDTCVESFSRQDMPFERILGEISVSRDMSHTPVYQNILSFQDSNELEYNFRKLETSDIFVGVPGVQTDLGIWMLMKKNELNLSVGYSTDLFEETTIRKWMVAYENLLDIIISNDNLLIRDISILTESDNEVLAKVNDTAAYYPQDKLIHQMFEERAKQMPDKTAVVFGDLSVSYKQLNERANQLARHLIKQGAAAGTLVGICLPRSVDMLVAVVGVLKSGAAYVPLDPEFPKERLSYMAEDAGMRIIISNNETENILGAAYIQSVQLDRDREQIESCDKDDLLQEKTNSKDLAYVIYTSGSTGKPKGIELEHRSVVNFIYSMAKTPGVKEDDRVLAITTLSFDIAVLELLLPLSVGATVVLLTRDQSLDGAEIEKCLDKYDVTIMQATPATWRLLLSSKKFRKRRIKALCGGEALSKELSSSLTEYVSELWNMYGPTETTVWSTCYRINREDDTIYIGKPIDNTTVYILDESLNQVPVGVLGELYIGGDGLARGYHNRPELTAERFVDNPFNPGSKMYRTGDLVRLNNIGELVCLGRTDFQVKLRGFRIELGEIETAIGNVVGIKQGIVVVKRFSDEDERLVAYCISEGDVSVEEAEIKTILRKKLPDYMVPQHYVRLDEFPLTANNKIDRKALLSYEVFVTADKETIEPRTETEESLVQIWSEVLHAPRIGIRDDFFQMGGHSLLAIQLIDKIRSRYKVSLQLADFLRNSTLQDMAAEIDSLLVSSNDIASHSKKEWTPLVLLGTKKGDSTPLFCAAGIGGHVMELNQLAKELGDIPLWGLETRGVLEGQTPHSTIEDLAKEHVAAIRTVQAHGPYFISGYSFGGVVAFEIAQQLTSQNEEVAWLGLIDASGPAIRQRTLIELRIEQAKRLVDDPLAYVKHSIERRKRDRAAIYHERYAHIYAAMSSAYDKYRPQPYKGDAVLFQTPRHENYEDMLYVIDEYNGWRSYILGKLEVIPITGRHLTVVQERKNVILLANEIKKSLPVRSV